MTNPPYTRFDNSSSGTCLGDIAQILALANVRRVVVIGTSFGGLLAMALGAYMPFSLAGLVLTDADPQIEQGTLDGVLAYISVDRPQPDWESAREAIRKQMPGAVFQTDAMFDAMVRNTCRKGKDGLLHFDWDVSIVKPIMEARGVAPNLWTNFRGLSPISLLALRGAESDVLSEECFMRMGREYPGAGLVTVPGAGHAPTLAEPECFVALDAFLRDL